MALVGLGSPMACRWEGGDVLGRRLPTEEGPPGTGEGRLTARPPAPGAPAPTEGEPGRGLQPLNLGSDRDGFLYVPSGYQPDTPLPLVVTLHGAGGDALGGLSPFRDRADDAALLLLSPDSRDRTWDAILGGYGPDVVFLDRALRQTFERYAVDPGNLAVAGFSDGASYALGLGLANGDLFGRVVAFSPGFTPPARRHGRPRIFISHGILDDVLPIDRCSRRIVPRLQKEGYDVRYREFDGGHAVPPEIVDEALAWWQGGG